MLELFESGELDPFEMDSNATDPFELEPFEPDPYEPKPWESDFDSGEVKPFDDGTVSYATCAAIGFFTQGGRLASVLYNSTLTLYYILLIRCGWKESRIKKAAEPYLHIVPLLLGWTTAIVGVATRSFNITPTGCDFASYPPGCFGSERCTRARYGEEFLKYFFIFPLWAVWVFLIVGMILIYMKIRAIEDNTNRHNTALSIAQARRRRTTRISMISFVSSVGTRFSSQSPSPSPDVDSERRSSDHTVAARATADALAKKREKSRTFAKQALFYCLAFGISWFFFSLQVSFRFVLDLDIDFLALIYLSSILAPLQGFWNAIVYIRPQYLARRRAQKKKRLAELRREEGRKKREEQLAAYDQQPSEENRQSVTTGSQPSEDTPSTRRSSGFFNRRGSSRLVALSDAIFHDCEDSQDLSESDLRDDDDGVDALRNELEGIKQVPQDNQDEEANNSKTGSADDGEQHDKEKNRLESSIEIVFERDSQFVERDSEAGGEEADKQDQAGE